MDVSEFQQDIFGKASTYEASALLKRKDLVEPTWTVDRSADMSSGFPDQHAAVVKW